MIFYGWRQKNKTRQDKTRQDNNNLAKLEASLAPAEAEFGAVAKADQYTIIYRKTYLPTYKTRYMCF